MSAMIDLLPPRASRGEKAGHVRVARIPRALPFVEASCGRYTHRVRSAQSFTKIDSSVFWRAGEIHVAASCWCGMTILLSAKRKSQFVAEPSPGRPICATCEGRAIGAGMLGAPIIAGRPVKFSPQVGA